MWSIPNNWQWKTLADISEINPRRPRIQRTDDELTSFVPMEDVDEVKGRFKQVQRKRYGEVRRGYTYFEENDVLYAKITPSMENGKTAIARGLIDGFGFGTTEFHVFRPNKTILPEYLHYYIRRASFRQEAKQHFRGAVGQQRVPQDFLVTYPFPLPYPDDSARSLAEQQRIVARIEALLAEVGEMRKLQAEIANDIQFLFDAYSRQIFSEIDVTQPRVTLSTLASKIGSGSTPRGGKAVYKKAGVPFIRSLNVRWNKFSTEDLAFIDETTHEKMSSTTVIDGDVLLNITGASIGRACCVPGNICPANVNQHVSIIRPSGSLIPEYLMYWLTSPGTQFYINTHQSGATRQALTNSTLAKSGSVSSQ